MLSERRQSKYTHHKIPTTELSLKGTLTFFKKQNYRHSKRTSGCQGLGEEGRDDYMEHRSFNGGETILHDIVTADKHMTFMFLPNSTECTTRRVNLKL